jgi:YHS domain-containing protein
MFKTARATLIALVAISAGSLTAQAGEYENHCAMGMAIGKEVKTDCSISSEIDGKTYCFGNEDAKVAFMKDSAGNLEKANAFQTSKAAK